MRYKKTFQSSCLQELQISYYSTKFQLFKCYNYSSLSFCCCCCCESCNTPFQLQILFARKLFYLTCTAIQLLTVGQERSQYFLSQCKEISIQRKLFLVQGHVPKELAENSLRLVCCFFFLIFFVELIYNIVLLSVVEQSDSVIHIYL